MLTLEKLFTPLVSEGTYFKLICGATFRDYAELTHMATIYTLAGAKLIDVAATTEAVDAALAGVRKARRLGSAWLTSAPLPLVMVSVGDNDDPHVKVAVKDDEKCAQVCPHCQHACPHEAIDDNMAIVAERCVGCSKCVEACPEDAIALQVTDFSASVEQLWDAGARGLELHVGTGENLDAWEPVVRNWCQKGGIFSVSVNAEQLPAKKAVPVIRKLSKWAEGRMLVQADGKPISGEPGELSTVAAVEYAGKLIAAGIPHVQAAGGTNDLTGRMAREKGVALTGVGIGSFARGLIRDIRGLGDPNGGMSEAISRARKLVASVAVHLEEK